MPPAIWTIPIRARQYRDRASYPASGLKYCSATRFVPRPCLSERIRIRIWGQTSFLSTEALFAFFSAFPCLYRGLEALFIFFRPAVAVCGRSECMYIFIHSDRPRLYENQSDLPPNSHSLEKHQGAGRVQYSQTVGVVLYMYAIIAAVCE